ncbi:alkaline phosphatase family protein [Actinomadura fibrosa]|uniref:Alkaline phosphatase family protein n=1 Tax=Actinomadura fibrosa TaxID=111802 RepID=A0ABW2XTI9_9ACTN|nr:alkaline phosphatase family protein [Actinomadura fibrosa]
MARVTPASGRPETLTPESRSPARRPRTLAIRPGLVLLVLLLDWAALALTIAVLPGISADAGWDVLLAAVLLGLVAAPLRPLLAALAGTIGWAGVVCGWLLGQALLVFAALALTPGIDVDGFGSAFLASWIYSAVVSAGLWAVTAGDGTAVLGHLLRTTRGARGTATATGTAPGVVMIQIDGLSAPVLEWSLRSGNLPTLGRWIRSGSHRAAEWHVGLPATTPASQAGLLHGAAQVPAFRWYEKDTGRLVVTNHPKDSAFVEARLSDGRGLLADGGVSVGNVFSGDAPTSRLTMSTASAGRRDAGRAREISAYVVDPYGLTRSLVLTTAEMVKEMYQARRQRVRGMEPRVRRAAAYVALRGVTNVLLRDLNMTLVAEHMMRGAPAVYCDFVDYDEIAHHAGPTRPESLASLEGIDRVLGTLELVAAGTPRPYRFVVLSDHGQSQGATFRQRYGMTLEELVRDLMDGGRDGAAAPRVPAGPSDGSGEQWGRVGTLLAEVGEEPTVTGRVGRGVLRRHERRVPAAAADGRPEVVVLASGNLGTIYFPRRPGRLTAEEIEALYPRLLSGLARHPGIGFVLVRSRSGAAVVLGADGRRELGGGPAPDGAVDGDPVEGDDPLARFGPHAAADLRRYDALPHVADIVVNSRVDAAGAEVAAFEELVGCHGGLGGWQGRAVLVHPADWTVSGDLDGAGAVHRQLVTWLNEAGLRDAAP